MTRFVKQLRTMTRFCEIETAKDPGLNPALLVSDNVTLLLSWIPSINTTRMSHEVNIQ